MKFERKTFGTIGFNSYQKMQTGYYATNKQVQTTKFLAESRCCKINANRDFTRIYFSLKNLIFLRNEDSKRQYKILPSLQQFLPQTFGSKM